MEKLRNDYNRYDINHIRENSIRETENISHKYLFLMKILDHVLVYLLSLHLCVFMMIIKKNHSTVSSIFWREKIDRADGYAQDGNKQALVSNPKNGKNEDVFFSVPSYVTIGDTYQGNFVF